MMRKCHSKVCRAVAVLTATVLLPALAGCAGGGGNVAATRPLPLANAAGRARAAAKSHPWLYVSGTRTNQVEAYDLGVSGTPPRVETISTGVDQPDGLAIDALGTLYVMNGNNTVTAFADGDTAPSLSIGVQSPVGVAVTTTSLDVWIVTRGSPPSLFVYHKGQTTPYKTITSSLLKVPSQIVFDAAQNLYISDNDTGVSEVLAGTFTPKAVALRSLPSCPTGIALDNQSGKLFLSGCDGATLQYKVGRPAVKLKFDETFPADNIAIGLYRNATTLFLPDLFSSTVYFYNESGQQTLALSTGVTTALGVAYKRAGL